MSKYVAAPKTPRDQLEFLGVPGSIGISAAVTFFGYFFSLSCDERGCPPTPLVPFFKHGFIKYTSSLQPWLELYDREALKAYLAWYAFCVVCWIVLPGQSIEGVTLRNGQRLKYKLNAFPTFLLTAATMLYVLLTQGHKPYLFIYDHWTGMVTATWLMAFAQACYVYLASYLPDKMLAQGGNSDSYIYNWFIGRELNPRIGSFDIKSFNELRPGMILWFIVNAGFVAKQYDRIGRITDSMVLVILFQSIYIIDSLWNEAAIFSTMDIVTDGFGFMLSVGDLLWVPCTYSLQARYLSVHPKDLGLFGTLGVLAIQGLGYYIFRVSNLEKHNFRNGRNPKNLTSMKTERGTRLLTSGWWGLSRHPNYLGDWLMAWAWCLPTGFTTPIPYYYVVYFAVLLVHRQQRDDHACKVKYGKDWDKYCKLVPSKIIPGIY